VAAVAVFTIAALSVAGVLGAGFASASTSLTVTLSASTGDGASATCSTSGTIVLTTGSDVSNTYAEADVNGVDGTALSPTEPSFVTDSYNSGSPRWVIELSNGNSLWGYPPNAGLNGSDFAWAVNNGNTYTSFATAYTAADAGAAGVTISDAFIVEDGDQPSTTDTISGATFDGQPLSCAAAPTPTPTPSSSTSPHTAYPTGGVQTGGGKPVSSPWLPFGLGLALFGGLALTGGAVALRRQRG